VRSPQVYDNESAARDVPGRRSVACGGTTPLHPPIMGGLRGPPSPPAVRTTQKSRRPHTVAEVKALWVLQAGRPRSGALCLLDRDGGAGALEGSLGLLRGLLVDLLKYGLGRAVD
jgi:hypothetical protein